MQALLDFVTSPGYRLNCHKIHVSENQIRLHYKNVTLETQPLLDFVTTLGQRLNSHKMQYVTESDKAALSGYDNENRQSSHRIQCVTESDCHKIQ